MNAGLRMAGLGAMLVVVGAAPAHASIAKKYAGQADAAGTLAASIRQGGSGKWGPGPMPPQPALSDAEVTTLAAWVAAQAK